MLCPPPGPHMRISNPKPKTISKPASSHPPAAGLQVSLHALACDRLLAAGDGGGGLEADFENNVLSIGNAPLHAARAVGARANLYATDR